jgi:phosphoribosylamine--glycine ligase
MKILVVGSGGREHAIAWKLAQSNHVAKVYVAPGNAGTSLENKLENINLTAIPDLLHFAKHAQIDFTVVGPEVPLADGIVDEFRLHQLKIWGPTKFVLNLKALKLTPKTLCANLIFQLPNMKLLPMHLMR